MIRFTVVKKISFLLLAFSFLFLAWPTSIHSAGTTYYLDCQLGSDTNTGTSQSTPWKTLTKASNFNFLAGDKLLLKKGCIWEGRLTLTESGTSTENVLVSNYGIGELPLIISSTNGASSIQISGSYITIDGLYLRQTSSVLDAGCLNNPKGQINGVSFESGATNNTLKNSKIEGGYAGVFLKSGSNRNQVLNNQFLNNTMMSPLDTSSDNDAGAFGVLIHGDDNKISNNTFSGQDACSYDYGRDGSAVEVYGGQRNVISYNIARNSDAFTELGNSRSQDNTFAYNLYSSSLGKSIFLVTRGGGSGYGPVLRTKAYNNTVYLTGSQSQGFVCHGGCSPDILTLKNNIFQVVWKAGYADGDFSKSNNIYFGGQRQFTLGASDLVSDPQFVNSANNDFHLTSTSPAKNSGISESLALGFLVDLDNKTVPQESIVDRGAYEFGIGSTLQIPSASPTPTPTSESRLYGDTNGDGVVNFFDATVLIQNWFKLLNTQIDQNSDGKINSLDLAAVILASRPSSTATATATATPTATVSPSPSPSSGVDLKVTVADDATIRADSPTINFGANASLEVDASPEQGFLLKFVVTGIGSQSVREARVYLYNVDASDNGGTLNFVSDNSWQEETVTWSSAPEATSFEGSLQSVNPGNWYSLPVKVTKDGVYSYTITSTSSNGADYASHENTNYAPYLLIKFGSSSSSPAPTSTATAAPSVSPSPTGLPIAGSTIRVAALGDINPSGNTSLTSASGKNAASIRSANPDLIVTLGDMQYSYGTCSAFVNGFDKLWSDLVPKMYLTAGPTHDWNETNSNGQEYQKYFTGGCSGQTSGPAKAGADPAKPYSFNVGKWHFVSLSSGCSRYPSACSVSSETAWLASDLANAVSTGHPYIIAFWHEPYWTSSSSGHSSGVSALKPWIDLLYQYKAKMVLHGHQHGYERFVPQNNSSQAANDGIQTFIVGTGGIGFYSWQNKIANSAVQQSNTYGWLKLTLRDNGTYDWEFVPTSGGTFTDSGSR